MMDYYDSIVNDLLVIDENKFIPESDQVGNIEYKWRLDKKELSKLDNMVAQMIRRMDEGKRLYGRHEANYIIGVMDDGSFTDCNESLLKQSMKVLNYVTQLACAEIIHTKIHYFNGKMINHVIVQKKNTFIQRPENDIMILGPYDSGKSTMMGHLVHGQKDDGKGFCRKLILRHVHEKESGNTSSLAYDTIGFKNRKLVNYSCGFDFGMENIYKNSDILTNIIDTPGCMKYIKTIFHAISSIRPKNIIVCIPLDIGSSEQNIENVLNDNKDIYTFIIKICIVFDIKPIFCLTKCDLVLSKLDISLYKNVIGSTFNSWKNNICNEKYISTQYDFQIPTESLNHMTIDFIDQDYVFISSITSSGYDELNYILSNINNKKENCSDNDDSILFLFAETFVIPEMGSIFHGTLKSGVLKVNDTVNVLCSGLIFKMKIKSIQRKSLDVRILYAGESGSIMFYGNNDKLFDKTSIIVSDYWKHKIINKSKFELIFDKQIKCNDNKKYSLFVNNNIVSVELSYNEENNTYELISNVPFFSYDVGILRDETNHPYFIKFIY